MTTGDAIINGIIEGGLLHAQCAHNEDHGCVVVWSSGAAEQIEAMCGRQWLSWSGGRYPDDSIGDVIAAWPDGTITLDDGLSTWNPIRALEFVRDGGKLQKQ